MKTIIQSCILFVLIIMITITSMGLVTHSALKSELDAALSRGVEQTMNMIFVYRAYTVGGNDLLEYKDEVICDVLQSIILSKSSDNALVVNVYNKNAIDSQELEIEAIETYSGLLGKSREVKHRVKMRVDISDEEGKRGELYIKYDKPGENAELSETWTFSSASVSNIKNFLNSNEGATPSSERNLIFSQRYGYCRKNIS